MTTEDEDRPRLLTFRSGGWVLLASALLTAAVFTWAVVGALLGPPVVGDGRHVATYGFDLESCLVPRDQIVAGGLAKDALHALVAPPAMPGADVAQLNHELRGKFLVSTDRVVGVVVNGEARAYPLLIMNVHEVANDVVGGVPIAVTYNPLCDSVVVFDRRVGGQTLEFGVSGLLYQSNMLMFDRRAEAQGESLWSQLGGRAIAGPAAGTPLTVMPAALAAWADWLAAFPATTVIRPDPRMAKRYKETKYATYFQSESLMFPVSRLPPAGGPALKQRIVVVGVEHPEAFTVAAIARHASTSGEWRTTAAGQPVRFHVQPSTETVMAMSPDGSLLPARYAFWFAWYAFAGDPSIRQ